MKITSDGQTGKARAERAGLQQKGLLGELRAERFLKKQGMKIIGRRYRAPRGEIDLIAREGDTTVFVEVKYRPRGEIGEGARAVDADKRRHIRLAAERWLSANPSASVRFDVVEITASGIRRITDAF